jgi:hypothetical protein
MLELPVKPACAWKAAGARRHVRLAWAVMDVTAEGDLPTLRRWLDGVEDHPLRWFFKSRRREPLPPGAVYAWWRNPILTPIEETLVLLEAMPLR